MPCIEVFAAGDCLAPPTAGGRTGSRGWGRCRCRCPLVAFRAWPDPMTT